MLELLSPYVVAALLALVPAVASVRARRWGQAFVVIFVSVSAPLAVTAVLMATLLRGISGTLPAGGLDAALLLIWMASIGTPLAVLLFLKRTRRFERISRL